MKDEQSQTPAIYDRQLAIGIAGGNPEIAAELLDLLIQELPLQKEALERAYAAGNLEELRQLSHKLHGSASYCGTPALREAAWNLESVLPHAESAVIAQAHTRLIEEIRRLEEAYGAA